MLNQDEQIDERIPDNLSHATSLLTTPIGISMVCRTCHYWWGWADYGWCYSAETYLSGALQCADWIMRASGFVGMCENMEDDIVSREGENPDEETEA